MALAHRQSSVREFVGSGIEGNLELLKTFFREDVSLSQIVKAEVHDRFFQSCSRVEPGCLFIDEKIDFLRFRAPDAERDILHVEVRRASGGMEIQIAVVLHRPVRADDDYPEGLHLLAIAHCSGIVGRVKNDAGKRRVRGVGDSDGDGEFRQHFIPVPDIASGAENQGCCRGSQCLEIFAVSLHCYMQTLPCPDLF